MSLTLSPQLALITHSVTARQHATVFLRTEYAWVRLLSPYAIPNSLSVYRHAPTISLYCLPSHWLLYPMHHTLPWSKMGARRNTY